MKLLMLLVQTSQNEQMAYSGKLATGIMFSNIF